MYTIIKAKLVAAPAPPIPEYEGTLLSVTVPADDPSVVIREIRRVSSCPNVTLDWGDGNVETFTGSSAQPAHTYAADGTYHIVISDDLESIGYIGPNYTEADRYRERLVGLRSKATRLTTTLNDGFRGCSQLATLDLAGCALAALRARVFKDCSRLSGKLYFPSVTTIIGGSTVLPFSGCTGGITELHFAATSEAKITASTAYQADPTLGSGTARCVFDL